MHLRIGLLLATFFSYATNIYGLQRSHSLDVNMRIGEEKAAVKHRAIQGSIFIVPNELTYRGYQNYTGINNIVDAQGAPMIFPPQDVLVECCATSVFSQNWAACGHRSLGNNFPIYLPLSLLDGKDEGQFISFFFKADNDDVVKIELKCEQLVFPIYREYGSFEKTLQSLKAAFMRNPMCAFVDTKQLIQDGILEKRITTFGSESYSHGNHGFYFDCDAYDAEMKIAAGYDADDEMEFAESEDAGRCSIQ